MTQLPERKWAGKRILGSRAFEGSMKFKGLRVMPSNLMEPSGINAMAAWQSAMEGLTVHFSTVCLAQLKVLKLAMVRVE